MMENVSAKSMKLEENDGRFEFSGCGHIYGLVNKGDECYEDAIQAFFEELQKHVADDDAIILLEAGDLIEAGNKKIKCVTGVTNVITSKGVFVMDIDREFKTIVRKILQDENWPFDNAY